MCRAEMSQYLSLFCFLINIIIAAGLFGKKQTWTYDVIEISYITSNPDIVDLKLEIERLSRNEFGVSGFIDIKSDLYDNATIEMAIERSLDRSGPFKKIPWTFGKKTISQFVNDHYKMIVQPIVEKCAEYAPDIGDHFEAPLSKGCLDFRGCKIDTESLPNIMMDGYYSTHIKLLGPVEINVDVLAYIENYNL